MMMAAVTAAVVCAGEGNETLDQSCSGVVYQIAAQ
jgi:hypothetical protein